MFAHGATAGVTDSGSHADDTELAHETEPTSQDVNRPGAAVNGAFQPLPTQSAGRSPLNSRFVVRGFLNEHS